MATVGEQLAILEELRAADPQAVDFRQRADCKTKEFQETLSELRKREFIETQEVSAMGPEDGRNLLGKNHTGRKKITRRAA